MSNHDRKPIPEFPLAESAADDDLLIKRTTATGEDERLPIAVLRETAFGTAAAKDTGTDVGEVVELEDVGAGVPGLPAVDASQLQNLPIDEGMNEGQIAINEPISEEEFGHQFGIDDEPFFEIAFGDFGDDFYRLRITDVAQRAGLTISHDDDYTVRAVLFGEDLAGISSLTKVSLNGPEVEFGASVEEVNFVTPAEINNIKNETFSNATDDAAFNELDLGNRKLTTLQLADNLAISTIVNALANSEIVLVVEQTGAGNFEITDWPEPVIWLGGMQPSVAGPAGYKYVIRLYYDGSDYYGSFDPTAGVIKSLYESNDDTNAFTDANKAKVDFLSVTEETDLDFIRLRVEELDSAVVLVGDWDPTSGTFPGDSYAQQGWSYLVTADGTVDGIEFKDGDRIIALIDNASEETYIGNWLKADYTDRVSTVFGRTGSVTAQNGDYNADQITETASNKIMTAAERAKLENISYGNQVGEIPQLVDNGGFAALPANVDKLAITDPDQLNEAVIGVQGEYAQVARNRLAPLGLTTDEAIDLTAITLQEGDWDIAASIGFSADATTVLGQLIAAISLVEDVLPFPAQTNVPSGNGQMRVETHPGGVALGEIGILNLAIPGYRVIITEATTFHLVVQGSFTTSTLSAFGSLFARRVR